MMSVKTACLGSAAALVSLLAASSASAISPCCGIHDYEVDGVKVALMSVKRDNPYEITVSWELRNTTTEPAKVGGSFGGSGSSEAYSLVWDSYVVDTAGRLKYPVLKDSDGTPIAARHGGGKAVTLAGNKTLHVWAKFQVPAKVGKVSVYLPGSEPFDNIAIARFEPVDGARAAALGARVSAAAKAGQINGNGIAPCCSMHAYEVDGVQATLKSVQRDDARQITVRWQLHNTTAEAVKVGESFGGSGSSEAFSLVWDAYVIDPAARIKYSILTDSDGTPIGARHGGGKAVTLAGNKSLSLWARFPVPATVKTLSVYLPGTEPFENVGVARLNPVDGAR